MLGPVVGGMGTAAARAPSPATATPEATTGLPAQAPSFAGAFIIDHGRVFAWLGYGGFFNLWYGVGYNGSEVYADSLWLLLYNLVDVNLTFPVDIRESGLGWENQTVAIPARGYEGVNLPLLASLRWTSTLVDLDGTKWSGYVSTPASLLPLNSLNLGGLDLLVMGVLSESLIFFGLASWAAQRVMRKAKFAPPFRLIIWGHVFLGSVFLLILADYQFIDQTFAGWSPLLYIFPLVALWFLANLSPHNRSWKREALQLVGQPNEGLSFRRYLLRLIENPSGDVCAAREGWSDLWARYWGHYVVLSKKTPDPKAKAPFIAPVENLLSPTGTRFRDRKWSLFGGRHRVAKTESFAVQNPQDDDVDSIVFVKPGLPLAFSWPRLVWSKTVELPAVYNDDGVVIKDPRVVRKWSFPHYEGGSAEAIDFEEIHYKYGLVAAAAQWLSTADLSRMLGESEMARWLMDANRETTVRAEVDSVLRAYFSFVGRTWADISEEEASQEATQGDETPPSPADEEAARRPEPPKRPRRPTRGARPQ